MQRVLRVTAIALIAVMVAAGCGGGGGNKAASSSSSSKSSSSSASKSSSSDSDSDSDSGSGSTSSRSGGGGGSADACKVSASDISKVVGFDVTPNPGSGGTACTFSAGDTDQEHIGSTVSIDVSSFTGGDALIDQVASGIAGAFSTSADEVPGVGDRAFFINAGIVGELVVFDGGQQVTIAIGGLSNDNGTRKDQCLELAKLILK